MIGREASFSKMKSNLQEISLRRSAVSGVVWLGVMKTLSQTFSWIITIYIARILSPADYGLMGMTAVLIAFMQLFNELGLGAAIIQKRDLTDDDVVSTHWTVVAMNIILYLAVFFLAVPASLFFHEERIIPMIRVLGLNFLINSIGFVSFNMLNRTMDFKKRSVGEFVATLFGSISTLYLAIRGMGVWSLILGSLILEATRNVLFQVYYPWLPRLSYSYQKVKRLTVFGSQIVASRVLWYLYSNLDNVIAGKMLGKSVLGYYSVAMQFAMMPLDKIMSLVTQVALPAFSRIEHDAELTRKYFLKTIRFVAFLTFPLFFGIILVAQEAVIVLLTDKWSSIIVPLQVLCLASILRAINSIYAPLFIAKGKANVLMMNNLLLALMMPIGFYVGSFYGLLGFSISWIIVFPVPFTIITVKLLKLLNIPLLEYINDMKHFFVGSLFMASVTVIMKNQIFIHSTDLVKLITTCLVGLISYCFYQMLFNRQIISETKALLARHN